MGKYRDCLEYIERYWDKITVHKPDDDKTLIGLPYPYLCPNADMFQELYYWDSYFLALGVENTSREQLVVDITNNLLHLLERFGRIPNTNRFYHLSRSQPPLLTSMILMSFKIMEKSGSGGLEWLANAYKLAVSEYWNVWRSKDFPDQREVYEGLSRYYDLNIWHDAAEAESGWDMTCRYKDHCLDYIPIDLNCFLFKYERDFQEIARVLNLEQEQKFWEEELDGRRDSINNLLWNDQSGYFFDYNFRTKSLSEFVTMAGFSALWSGLANEEQAAIMVKNVLPLLECEYGVVTTEKWIPDSPDQVRQWAWPNGWAPLNYLVVKGLDNYGYRDDAGRIAEKWLNLITEIFDKESKIFEKYNVVEGCRATSERYPDQVGFGWTNAIFERFYRYLEGGAI